MAESQRESLNHELGSYGSFYLGCAADTAAEVERRPDASESPRLPAFRVTWTAASGTRRDFLVSF